MNKSLRPVILAFAGLVTAQVGAGESWTPEVHFNLEYGSYKETLIWVSGFGYAADAAGRVAVTGSRPWCSPATGYISSKELLGILNERYDGQRITSEQATVTLIKEISKRYPCS